MTSLFSRGYRVVRELFRVVLLRRSLSEFVWFGLAAVLCIAASFSVDDIFSALGYSADLLMENGPIETAQAFIVGAAGLLFAVAALRFDYELFYGGVFGSALCGMIAQREIPNCDSLLYPGGFCLTDHGKDLWSVAVIALFIGLFALRRIPLAKHIRDLNFFWAVPFGYGFVLMASAEIAERSEFVTGEESMETAAYLFILIFALALSVRPDWFDVRRKPALKPS